MLKKLIGLLSKDKASGNITNTPEIITHSLTISSEAASQAKELKDAGDISFRANNLGQAELYYQQSIEINPNQPAAYNNRGIALYYLQRADEALKNYDHAITLNPGYAQAYYNRGIALNSMQRWDEALVSYDHAIALNPAYIEAHYNRGLVLNHLKRLDEALASYDQAIALNPDYAEAFNNRGVLLNDLKRWDEALANYDRAIVLKPDYAEAFNNKGAALNSLRRFDEALASFDHAITLTPDNAEANNNRGTALNDLMRLDEALASYDRAIALNPDYADAYYNRGIVLNELKRQDEALISYDHAIALNPDYAEAYYNRGIVLNELKRQDEALNCYERAITLKADYIDAYYNQGILLLELNRLDEALTSFDRAIALKPDHAESHHYRAIILNNHKRFSEALASYNRAIALKPDYLESYYNRGNILHDLNRLDEALASYDHAIKINPNYADAHYNRGIVLNDLKRLREAFASYDRALTLRPDHEFLYGYWLMTKMMLCDWSDHDATITKLTDKTNQGEKVLAPFITLSQSNSRALQKKAAQIHVQSKCPTSHELPPIPKYPKHDKIRIGYFSADFRNHPVSYLTAELFEIHDRSRFELTAFAFGPSTKDEMRTRVAAAFDQFIEVQQYSDQEVALMARKLEIDIAIDLGGFTSESRTGIFALRAAPVQMSYLGYLGTMSADYMDYLIADTTIIPGSHIQDYTEKIVYLPNYQVNDTKRSIAKKTFTKRELGLPPTGFVFCCFNNNYKITPSIFDSWMRILQQVEGSVLWLLGDNETTESNLKAEATRRNIDAQRLVFAKRLPLPEYLARYRAADLFLDTSPYNAGTTASDALWAGLPVLTFLGETFAGRMAASLLYATHLPELVANSQAEYEAFAVNLATHPDKLMRIRQALTENLLTTPLFNTRQFSRHIESAYSQIYERHHADLMPDHIYIKADHT